MTSALFTPLKLRQLEFKNRIFVSPMCQYSAVEGVPNDWHFIHLGSRAIGGAACVVQEATAVTPEGRITAGDFGLWNEAQAVAAKPIVAFIKKNGARAAIQLAHAGRKASSAVPWAGGEGLSEAEGGWTPVVGASPIPFSSKAIVPHELSVTEIKNVVEQFVVATKRSLDVGYDVVEIHAAHGYLVHSFLSPLSNQRTDHYGGSLENRMRLAIDVAKAVRAEWPNSLPVFVRISASDWVQGGWDIDQSIILSRALKDVDIDLIDASSGGAVPDAKIPAAPGYQVPFAERIRKEASIATGAVGIITKARQAEDIIANGQADIVLLAREMLRDPYWPLHAAESLGVDVPWPVQYERAKRAHA